MRVPSFPIDNFDEITFENRNKAYGAYYLRTHQNENIVKGMLSAFTIVAMIIVAPKIYAMFAPPEVIKEYLSGDIYLDNTKVETAKLIHPKTPAIAKIPAAMIKQIKYVIPTVVDDHVDHVETKIATNAQLSNVITGARTLAGATNGENPLLGTPLGTGSVAITPIIEVIKAKEPVFNVVDEMPSFEGGEAALFKYLSNRIKYPRLALENGIKGKVILQFVVNTDGSIQDVKVLRGIGGGCDEEALNAVKKMPTWKPGSMNGKNVRVKYTLPVSFLPRD